MVDLVAIPANDIPLSASMPTGSTAIIATSSGARRVASAALWAWMADNAYSMIASVGDDLPANPIPNALHYLTSGEIGFYIFYKPDAETDGVWIETSASSSSGNLGPFPTRAALETWAQTRTPDVGTVFWAGALGYVYLGTGTILPDLPGYAPAGPATFRHFKAAGDGVADDTDAVQAAVDSGLLIKEHTDGKFLLTDAITGRLRLIGAGYNFAPMNIADASDLSGTVFITALESGDVDRLFDLEAGSVMRDCLIWFSMQDPDRAAPWTPVETPWAIGVGTMAEQAYNVRDNHVEIDNVMALDFTHGLQLNKGCERGRIARFQGNCFMRFIEADACYDLVRITDCHHWPFGGNTNGVSAEEETYLLDNCTAYRFGRVDGLVMDGCFAWKSATALEFYPSESGGSLDLGASTNFAIDKFYTDGSNAAVWVHGTYDSGQRVSGRITNSTIVHYWDVNATGVTYSGPELETILVETDFKEITFDACTISASGRYRNGSHVKVTGTNGTLKFGEPQVSLWDYADGGTDPCFVEGGTNSQILVDAPSFFASNHTKLTSFGSRVIYSGDVKLTGYAMSFTPVLTCDTPGDLSVGSITAQTGMLAFDGEFIHVQVRLAATPTYTTASGQIKITGLPITVSVTSEAPMLVNGATLGAGFTMPAVQAALATNYLSATKFGTGASAGPMDITTLASGAAASLLLSATLRA
jgi:hypothetical protein